MSRRSSLISRLRDIFIFLMTWMTFWARGCFCARAGRAFFAFMPSHSSTRVSRRYPIICCCPCYVICHFFAALIMSSVLGEDEVLPLAVSSHTQSGRRRHGAPPLGLDTSTESSNSAAQGTRRHPQGPSWNIRAYSTWLLNPNSSFRRIWAVLCILLSFLSIITLHSIHSGSSMTH